MTGAYVLVLTLHFSSWGAVVNRHVIYPTQDECLAARRDVRVDMPRLAAADNAGIVIAQCMPKQEHDRIYPEEKKR